MHKKLQFKKNRQIFVSIKSIKTLWKKFFLVAWPLRPLSPIELSGQTFFRASKKVIFKHGPAFTSPS